MQYIVLSIVCSVIVSMVLKLAPRWQVDMHQAIAGSYVVSTLACLWWLQPSLAWLWQPGGTDGAAWGVLVALGILLPTLFLVEARSVRDAGIVRTDAAQRLSLLLPLIAAFTLFGEQLTGLKLLGMTLGLAAIACIVARQDNAAKTGHGGRHWLLIVFVGMGVIDILFKTMAQLTQAPFTGVLLATFMLAFVLSLPWLGLRYARGLSRPGRQHLVAAVVIGIFNFGNILFYIRAHRQLANDPALVFSAMNIGVIVLATLAGTALFGERPGRFNRVGLVLAVAAVAMLAMAY